MNARIKKKTLSSGRSYFSQHVVPLVHDVSEVLVVQLICFVAAVEARGSEDGQEAGVVDALLQTTGRERVSCAPTASPAALPAMWGTTADLLVDGTVAVPAGHRLQHAAQEASVPVGLVLRTAGNGVYDGRENLQSRTNTVFAEL